MKFTYILLLIFTLLFPLLFSFEKKRIKYYQSFPSLFPSLFLVAIFFIVWDAWFTRIKVWAFNKDYVAGFYFLSLPLEEWLFFIIIPFSCVFIYEAMKYIIPSISFGKYNLLSAYILAAALGLMAAFNYDRIYTFITCILASVFILVHVRLFDTKYWGHFLLAYVIHLIPFFIVNGVLTSFPVVTYNNAENLGIRMGTIPVEDSIYSLLLLLMNITFFELFRTKVFSQKRKVLSHG